MTPSISESTKYIPFSEVGDEAGSVPVSVCSQAVSLCLCAVWKSVLCFLLSSKGCLREEAGPQTSKY